MGPKTGLRKGPGTLKGFDNPILPKGVWANLGNPNRPILKEKKGEMG